MWSYKKVKTQEKKLDYKTILSFLEGNNGHIKM